MSSKYFEDRWNNNSQSALPPFFVPLIMLVQHVEVAYAENDCCGHWGIIPQCTMGQELILIISPEIPVSH